jgi:hypothetical protein
MKKIGFLGVILVFLVVMSLGVLSNGFDVTLSNPANPSSDPGQTVDVSFDITNNGAETVTLNLVSDELTYGAYTISVPSLGTTTLTASETKTITFSVSIPYTQYGPYEATITATQVGNGTNTATLDYFVYVNELEALDVVDASLSDPLEYFVQEDDSDSEMFTVKNIGSVDINPVITFFNSDLEDSDDRKITFDPESGESLGNILPGDSKSVQLIAYAEDRIDLGLYSTDVEIVDNTADDKFSIDIHVEPEVCEDGPQGDDLEINIKEPDDGEEFSPGDTIQVEVDVDNNGNRDMDVVVEAFLYNLDDDDKIDEAEESQEVEEDNDEEFNLELEIPSDSDLDEDDTYVLYVKAYKDGDEDEECISDSVEIELERNKHDVQVTDISATPSIVRCGERVSVNVDIENMGTSDEDDVYVELISNTLGINLQSDNYDLDDYSDSDNDATVRFSVEIPEDARAGTYNIEAIVYFDDGDETDSDIFTLTVECGAIGEEPEAELDVLETSLDGSRGESVSIPVSVKNTGDETQVYRLEANPIGNFASSDSESLTLDSDEEQIVYLSLFVKEDASLGSNAVSIVLKTDSEILVTKSATINVEDGIGGITGGVTFLPTSRLDEFLDSNILQTVLWILGIVVLIVVIIYLLKLAFKK